MATTTSHNKKSSAVKRILSEARELEADASDEYEARPLETNIFEWHFTLRGPSGTEFENGLYHGRVLLPIEYPFRPPDLMLLTPNGRWECNKKICLTFTGYHESMWQPAWGIRTALLGVQGFMSARAEAAQGVASVDYPIEERRRLATRSRGWTCSDCTKSNLELLPDTDPDQGRKTEQLPEGLVVDTSGGKKGEQDETERGTPDSATAALAAQTSQSQTRAISSSGQAASAMAPAMSLLAGISAEGVQVSGPALADDDNGSGGHPDADIPKSLPLSEPITSRSMFTASHAGSDALETPTPETSEHADQRNQIFSQSPVKNDSAWSSSLRVPTVPLGTLQRSPSSPPRTPSAPSPPGAPAPAVSPSSRNTSLASSAPTREAAAVQSATPIIADADSNPEDAQFAQPLPANLRRGVPAEDLPAPRRPTRSEARVAQLDRAILTVVLLLCGLVVRRLI